MRACLPFTWGDSPIQVLVGARWVTDSEGWVGTVVNQKAHIGQKGSCFSGLAASCSRMETQLLIFQFFKHGHKSGYLCAAPKFYIQETIFFYKVLYGPNKSKQTIKVMSSGCVVFVLLEYTDSSPASTDGIGLTLIISLVVFTVLVLHRHMFWDVINLDTANTCKSCDTVENTSEGSPRL